MEAGRLEEACPKIQASLELEARSGTLLLLASCHEQTGKTASAWSEYVDAEALAEREGRQENAEKAASLAGVLEPKLSRLRIAVEEGSGGPNDLVVMLDGKHVPRGSLGSDLPIDPGVHSLAASSVGRQAWTLDVTIRPTEQRVVTVPRLASNAQSALPGDAPAPAAGITDAAAAAEEGANWPTWAWLTGAAGIALLGVGVGFEVDSQFANAMLEERCGPERVCDPAGDYDPAADNARMDRGFAVFVGFAVTGGAALAAGVVGLAVAAGESAPSPHRVSLAPLAGPGTAGLVLAGSFR